MTCIGGGAQPPTGKNIGELRRRQSSILLAGEPGLQESKAAHAAAAIEHFIQAMTKCAGAYAAVLDGSDAFVFTAGIGENSASIRAALCGKSTRLGVNLDERANTSGGPRVSSMDSKVSVWVIRTNEELIIAQHRLAVVRSRLV